MKYYSIMKGRNRNTAWLRITEEEWPGLNQIYEDWLDQALAANYKSLGAMTSKLIGKQHCQQIEALAFCY